MVEVATDSVVNKQAAANFASTSNSINESPSLQTSQFKALNKDVLVYYPDLVSTHWHGANDFKNDPR